MKALLIAYLLINSYSLIYAQELVFQKKNYRKVSYKIGETISIKSKDLKRKLTGKIIDLQDSIIVFNNYEVNVKNISHIYIDDKTKDWFIFRQKYDKILILTGGGGFALDLINSKKVHQETIIVSSILVGSGILFKVLLPQKMKITHKRKLKIVNKPLKEIIAERQN